MLVCLVLSCSFVLLWCWVGFFFSSNFGLEMGRKGIGFGESLSGDLLLFLLHLHHHLWFFGEMIAVARNS